MGVPTIMRAASSIFCRAIALRSIKDAESDSSILSDDSEFLLRSLLLQIALFIVSLATRSSNHDATASWPLSLRIADLEQSPKSTQQAKLVDEMTALPACSNEAICFSRALKGLSGGIRVFNLLRLSHDAAAFVITAERRNA